MLLLISCKDSKKQTDSVSNTKQVHRLETLQMIERIKEIKGNTNFRDHIYESGEKLKWVETEVNQAKVNNQISPNLYVEYGKTLLNAGRTQDAIDVFEEILELMPQNKEIKNNTKTLHEAIAIAYMRLGEQTNCIENHSNESCLFPIKGKGIHKNKHGSTMAIKKYKEILKIFPNDIRSKWIMNIAYMTLGEYPQKVPAQYLIPPEVFESDVQLQEFENVSMNLGLDVNDLAGGTILDDFNNDGNIDVMASSWGMSGSIRYFVNNGDGTFIDKSNEAGFEGLTGGLNMIQADYNNDGHLDFYIMRSAWSGFKKMGILPNSLLRNNGNGTFTDVTISSGIYSVYPTQSSIWFDFNADGWLDLFVGNETHDEREKHPAQLFLNKKDGTFKDIAPSVGLNLTHYIKGVTTADVDQNGLADIYISIINNSNKLFLNKGGTAPENWIFEEVSTPFGVEEPLESFPTWFFDYDNDGWEDLFVSCFDRFSLYQSSWEVAADYLDLELNSDFPRLYRNNNGQSFLNVTRESSLEKILPTMGCNFGDLNNDGYKDFYLGTGSPDYRDIVPNRMFLNRNGQQFDDVTYSGNFGNIQKGHGIGFADLDNDGDQDIYAVMGGALSGDIFQNSLFENPGSANKWINIQLTGTSSNRSAIGAKLKLSLVNDDGSTSRIYHTINSGGSFGANSLHAEIGLGNAASISKLEIDWPNGIIQFIDYGSIPMNRFIHIQEGDESYKILEKKEFDFARMDHTGHQMNE
jgi:hypothetical protein